MTVKVTLVFEVFFNSHTMGNIGRINYDMFTYELESVRGR